MPEPAETGVTFAQNAMIKARAAADHVGANLHTLHVTDTEVADHFAESVWHGEGLQINAHGTARFLLSREIQASGYRAVMAGEGADELFAGYDFVRPAVMGSDGQGGRLRQTLRLLKMLGPLSETERQLARVAPLLARASRAVELPETIMKTGALVLLSGMSLSLAAAAQQRETRPLSMAANRS